MGRKGSKETGITNLTKTTTSKKTRRQRQGHLLQIAKSLSQVQRQQPVRIEPGPSRTPGTRNNNNNVVFRNPHEWQQKNNTPQPTTTNPPNKRSLSSDRALHHMCRI